MRVLASATILLCLALSAVAQADDAADPCNLAGNVNLPISIASVGYTMPALLQLYPGTRPAVMVWLSQAPTIGEKSPINIRLHKLGGEPDSIETPMPKNPTSALYVVELGGTEHSDAPLVASGKQREAFGGEGRLTIKGVAELSGSAALDKGALTASSSNNFHFIEVPLGHGGIKLIGIAQAGFAFRTDGQMTDGAIHSGGGLSLVVPTTDKGQTIRFGVVGGPEIFMKGRQGTVVPHLTTGIEMLFF